MAAGSSAEALLDPVGQIHHYFYVVFDGDDEPAAGGGPCAGEAASRGLLFAAPSEASRRIWVDAINGAIKVCAVRGRAGQREIEIESTARRRCPHPYHGALNTMQFPIKAQYQQLVRYHNPLSAPPLRFPFAPPPAPKAVPSLPLPPMPHSQRTHTPSPAPRSTSRMRTQAPVGEALALAGGNEDGGGPAEGTGIEDLSPPGSECGDVDGDGCDAPPARGFGPGEEGEQERASRPPPRRRSEPTEERSPRRTRGPAPAAADSAAEDGA